MAVTDIVVNLPTPPRFERDKEEDSVTGLAGFVVSRVMEWREHREQNFDMKWEEYYRLWRGVWDPNDKVRNPERSRLIAPALQQAIEAQVAEFEEATFSRNRWFTIDDDARDKEGQDVDVMSTALLSDLERDNIKSTVAECYLNAALYGTGIAKIVVAQEIEIVAKQDEMGNAQGVEQPRIAMKVVPVDPFEFVIDPAGKNINDAMGVAHEMLVPRHAVLAKQAAGIYMNSPLGSWEHDHNDFLRSGEHSDHNVDGRIKITEYYGLVPRSFLPGEATTSDEENDALVAALIPQQTREGFTQVIDDMEMVEAWVTIANDSTVLRAQENPFLKKDRPFVAYQHDTVPNRFWGRGVAEKGYNVQKALDGELRARMDSLALSTYPMVAMDRTAVPRDSNFQVRPGRTILTNGDPNNVLREFKFSEPGAGSFRETAELERMIQMATGSMDSSTPIGMSPRNSTASGMSMIQAGAVKRYKRTLQNIERDFLNPLLEKVAHRYMQYDPVRYPFGDYIFHVKTGLGIVARELESAHLTQLLQTSEPGSPGYYMILRQIWDLQATENKEEMVEITTKLLQNSLQPKENPELKLKEMELQMDQQKIALDNEKFQWQRAMDIAEYRNEQRRINQRSTEYAIDMQKVEMQRPQADAVALEKTASAVEKLSKAQTQAVEAGKSQTAAITKLEDIMENARVDDEQKRTEARTEFMEIVRDLEARAQALEAREPAIQIIEGAPGPQGPAGPSGQVDNSGVLQLVEDMRKEVERLKSKEVPKKGSTRVERDENGLITSVGGRKVKRNAQGLIEEI